MAEDIFSTEPKDYHLLNDKFEKFLFRWAKVEDATSEEVYNHVNRGVSYDPRKIAFLERITGLNFINANKESVAKAKESWEGFYNTFLNRFLTQATMNKIFPRTNYDFKNDALHINSTLDEVIANAKFQAPKQGLATYYAYVVNIIKLNKSEFNDPDFDKKIEEILIYSK